MRISSLFKSTLIVLISSLVMFVPTHRPISEHPATINEIVTIPKPTQKLPGFIKQPQALLATKVIKTTPAAPETPKPVSLPSGSHEDWMAQAGIAQSDWGFVDFIMSRESGWCPTKWQGQHVCPGSYAPTKSLNDGWVGYGLCQSTPGIKMSTIGGDYLNDPVQQLKWCAQHANTSHGGWSGSYNYWLRNGNW